MKKYICILFCVAFFLFSKSQQVTFNNINSSNVLEYYKQNLIQQQDLGYVKSLEITTQIGNGNTIETSDKTPNYLELIQNGNYNTTYFTNPNNYPTNAEIKINGSGNYIDVTGSNSISDGMKITINANDMTIFMRNY